MSIIDSPGQVRATAKLVAARGSVRELFEGTGLGFTLEDAAEYLDVGRVSVGGATPLDERQFARLVGLCCAFAAVCVEQDRAVRPPVELCTCRERCGDTDPDGVGTCKGLAR